MRVSYVPLVVVLLGASAVADGPPGRRVIGVDRGKVTILGPGGEVEWSYPCRETSHTLQRLANGNLMFQTGPATVVEVTPEKKVVWTYTGEAKPPYSGPVEIHAFERLADGLTMIAETGNRRIIEVDRDGKIVKEVALQVDKPHPHRDTRQARKLPNGHYLVCHEGDGVVREYDGSGKVVWSYALDLAGRPRSPGHSGHGTEVYTAIRKPDGNTLIAAGNGNRVIEVDPAGKTVWSVEQDELPGIRLAWVTTLDLRPNGNLVIGNCHAGPENPQLIEVTRDKKVVWTLKDFTHFGDNLACAMVVD
ncbi:MAG: WD40 repeat domain-containing protein [Isosphaeraceae bacterium]